jgi:hypothetical protein
MKCLLAPIETCVMLQQIVGKEQVELRMADFVEHPEC